MAPEGLCSEDAQQELVFPRSNEKAGMFHQERKPVLNLSSCVLAQVRTLGTS